MLWHDVFSPELGERERERETSARTHSHTTLIKCKDELDNSLVRRTLLMLIRGLEGYPSSWSRGEKSQRQGRT